MAGTFENILVPVDFTLNTEIAIKKAMEIAEKGSAIHLLYVQCYGYPGLSPFAYQFVRPNERKDYKEAQQRLNEWKKTIEKQSEGIEVSVSIDTKHDVQKGIEKKARSISADLIIIGKRSHHTWLTFLNTVAPAKLIKKTGVPVLTVKPGSISNTIKTIIVPIGDTNGGKMQMIEVLCRHHKVKVYLATFVNDYTRPLDFYKYNLMKCYQWLRTVMHIQVEYAVLHGKNRAKSILNFAKEVEADMIILNPEIEANAGWLNMHISDLLDPTSKAQILLVKPQSLTVV